jgi:hypothetical protein
MARINIEECWWTDPRRSKLVKLVGDENAADGMAVRMWRLAQEFWGRSRGLVPTEIFETLEANAKLIQAKLAEVRGEYVYVKGSSQYLDWHAERKEKAAENGQKGGRKSAQRPRNAKGQLLKCPSNSQAPSKQKPSTSKPSDSDSDSDSDSRSGTGSGQGSTGLQPAAESPSVIKLYCDLWKARYKSQRSPDIRGKTAGQLNGLAKDLGLDRARVLITAYLQMPDEWFVTKTHDVSTLLSNLAKVALFADSGRMITRSDIKQLEKKHESSNLDKLIEEGKI